MDKQTVVWSYVEQLSARQVNTNMDKPQKHYAECKKPQQKYILSDNLYIKFYNRQN